MTPFKELLITIVLACAVPLIPHTSRCNRCRFATRGKVNFAYQRHKRINANFLADTKGSRTPWLRWLFNVKGALGAQHLFYELRPMPGCLQQNH